MDATAVPPATAPAPNGASPPAAPGPSSTTRRRGWQVFLFGPLVLGPVWVTLLGGQSWLHGLGTWSGLILVGLVVTCAVTDLRWRKIPNWATYPALLWALVLNMVGSLTNHPPRDVAGAELGDRAFWQAGSVGHVGLSMCLFGALVCFVLMFMIYRLAKGGAGDVKLATALGALLGPVAGIHMLLYTYLVAGVVVLAWAIWTLGPVYILTALVRLVGSFFLPGRIAPPSEGQTQLLRRPVPLALFFAIGAVAAFLGLELP